MIGLSLKLGSVLAVRKLPGKVGSVDAMRGLSDKLWKNEKLKTDFRRHQ